MEIKPVLKSQYHAGMKVLKAVIEKCPDATWNSPYHGLRSFWRVAYHTLFFTDYYLQKDHNALPAWEKHRPEAECTGPLAWENNRQPKPCEPYTREEILEYWTDLNQRIDSLVDALILESPDCGFPWYQNFSKLEHQLVNLRHLQHHAAALSVRLKESDGITIGWVSKG